MAAFGAHAEQRHLQLLADERALDAALRLTKVQPAQFRTRQELDAEAGVLQKPSVADAAGRHDHGHGAFEAHK